MFSFHQTPGTRDMIVLNHFAQQVFAVTFCHYLFKAVTSEIFDVREVKVQSFWLWRLNFREIKLSSARNKANNGRTFARTTGGLLITGGDFHGRYVGYLLSWLIYFLVCVVNWSANHAFQTKVNLPSFISETTFMIYTPDRQLTSNCQNKC